MKSSLHQKAVLLAQFTVFYNLGEGIISILFGVKDETLSLFGFGVDSFVEVMSGIGVWHMLRRLEQQTNPEPDRFERRALTVTGSAFYILALSLVVTAALNLYENHHPQTTFWGIIIALVSIISMWVLVHWKMKVGKALHSPAIIADAHCTRACLYLSVVLLSASVGYELTGVGGIDAVGALIIAILAFREGREAFDKSKSLQCSCGGDHDEGEEDV